MPVTTHELKGFKDRSFSSIFYVQKSVCSSFKPLSIFIFLLRELLTSSLQRWEKNTHLGLHIFTLYKVHLSSGTEVYTHLSLINNIQLTSRHRHQLGMVFMQYLKVLMSKI